MAATRAKTFFGIVVPAWKDDYFPKNYETIPLRFVINGYIPSKKNLQNAKMARGEAVKYIDRMFEENGSMSKREVIDALDMCYAYFKPNDLYNDFVKEWRPKLVQQMAWWSARFKDKGLIFPIEKCACSIKLYFRDRYKADNGNKTETIHDLLKECGVIIDDNYTVLNPTNSKGACYYQKIPENIVVVDLTIFKEQKQTTLTDTLL